jgi:hypothetical protein
MPFITAKLSNDEKTDITLNTDEISSFQRYRKGMEFGKGQQTLVNMNNATHYVLDEDYDYFQKKVLAAK